MRARSGGNPVMGVASSAAGKMCGVRQGSDALFIELLLQGGWFLAPILLASLVGVTFFVERLLYLRRDRVLSPKIRAAAPGLIAAKEREALRVLLATEGTAVGRVLLAGLELPRAAAGQMRALMEDAGRRELYLMKRRTGVLSSIANISPLLGLLGTVVGMISMFQGVVAEAALSHGAADIGTLADGIWQALLTTAAGLIVAIPIYLGHRFVLGRIDAMINEIEEFGRALIRAFAVDEAEAEDGDQGEEAAA
ncbi:MotA/TolQ/ExbB proton channel family protein [Pseudenhygromyxa sp. WMMC2535]|uniref:MotA/TolQ/ExbB proton channel family protein n=1 Tax=Pseudenhygromyxa sp. WMMC2535 TaxID=2712867 RepID=UPI001552154F|nr:MotA/TolQ/ExbB proton channel family protein [Pseudenhygromyxa sp. WMMC2535]